MIYATVADMAARFGERELIELTDPELQEVKTARIELKLGDAQAFADSYVGVVYQLPLQGCAKPEGPTTVYVCPPQLTRIVCDVARYFLYDDLAPEHEVALRFKGAQGELQAIAAGRAVLTCPWGGKPGAALDTGALNAGEALYEFSPRQITDESLRGFA